MATKGGASVGVERATCTSSCRAVKVVTMNLPVRSSAVAGEPSRRHASTTAGRPRATPTPRTTPAVMPTPVKDASGAPLVVGQAVHVSGAER